MALALALLYCAGATIGALTLILPHSSMFNDGALWSNIAIAYAGSVAIAAAAGRLPPWSLNVLVGVGTLVITRAIYYSGDLSSFYSLWYVWVGLYAFFFFDRVWGVVHLAIIGAAYAWALTQVTQPTPLARWVMTMGTILIAAVLMDVLATRVRRRAAEADARAQAMAAVANVAHELARRTSVEAAAPAVCDAAVDVAGAKGAMLWEPTPDGSSLMITAATEPGVAGTRLPFVNRPSGVVRAYSTGESFFAARTQANPNVDQRVAEAVGAGSALFQPVSRDDAPIGVLAVYWAQPLERLDDEIAQVIHLLAVEAAIAIERAETLSRLEHVARTDDLTGLANRRSWDEHLGRELARAKREGAPLAVAMLDLDYFKDYNDRHGHQAGDRLLKEASAAWQGLVRDTDILARYGGEEFALALPNTDLDRATAMLERLRAVTPENERSSAGVVCWDGAEDASSLIDRADRALYAAKRGGRDRVVAA